MADLHNNECLSFGDALFLYIEREGMPLSVASVSIFEGIIPLDDCLAFIESKLPLIPRYRQRVIFPPLHIGPPTWEYDRQFDIRNHIRQRTLKRGTIPELQKLAGEILSVPLDRRHPLWDVTLVAGLKGNRTAMILRVHHALVDGIAGVALMRVVMDPSPEPPVLPKKKQRFKPPPPRDQATLLLEGLAGSFFSAVQRVLTMQSDLLMVAERMVASGANGNGTAESSQTAGFNSATQSLSLADLTRLLPELTAPTAKLPFNIVCRGPQKFHWTEIPLAEIKAVKHACGATVNDVYLAVMTGAIRRYAELHGCPIKGQQVRIVVPVSVRGKGDVSELGNRITFLPVTIPLDILDTRELIHAIRERLAFLKSIHAGELVGLLGALITSIPFPLQATALPLLTELPLGLCNIICTNVPGPKMPLYFIGHRMLSCYPRVPIGADMGFNCAVLTYNGVAYFGFTGDANAAPDLGRFEKLVTAAFAQLRKGAGVRVSRPKRTARKKPAAAAQVEASVNKKDEVVVNAAVAGRRG